jgi:hypothetical protein
MASARKYGGAPPRDSAASKKLGDRFISRAARRLLVRKKQTADCITRSTAPASPYQRL